MMKCLNLFVALLLVGTQFVHAQTSLRAIFIGNSYIYTNDLPEMVSKMALESGDTLHYRSSTPGGATFASHLSNGETQQLIAQGDYEVVVLQEQSQYPAFPLQQVETECFPAARSLCEQVRAAVPTAMPIFFMTWGREHGDEMNCPYYPPICTYEGMDSLLYERYTMMAEQNHAVLSPVGRVWRAIRTQHPDIQLYSGDGSHPSQTGTFAAALTFYTVFFQKSPQQITHYFSLPEATALQIIAIVQEVVYEQLDYWYRFALPATQVANHNLDFQLYPNPASQTLFIQTAQPLSHAQINIYDMSGKCCYTASLNTTNTIQLDVNSLKSGVYYVEIVAQQGKSVQKMIVR